MKKRECEKLTKEKIESIYIEMARRFREERERKKISVIQLEKMTGIDRTAIYRMENGKRRFGFENIIRMCSCLGIELNDLYKIPVKKKNSNRAGGTDEKEEI